MRVLRDPRDRTDTSRTRPRRRARSSAGAWTLPLFEPLASQLPVPASGERTNRPARAKELALHVYWSASVESHVLALAAMRAEYPSERRALIEIRAKEEELKETAHRLLAAVWGISIGAADPSTLRHPHVSDLRREA
jgi:hypothetical protein